MPHHDPTEFPEPTYKEAIEGWQHSQVLNAQLLRALEGVVRFDVFIDTLAAGKADGAKEALANVRIAIKAAKS